MQRQISVILFALLVLGVGALVQAQSSNDGGSSRAPFVKKLTLETFGYDLARNGAGYEIRGSAFSSGPANVHGLECPYCWMFPLITRSRQTLQPFGAVATYRPFGSRVELFAAAGGSEAWMPDGLMRNRRGSSYNDSWLLQAGTGVNAAVDRQEHLWLGVAARYLKQAGVPQGERSHWNTFSGNATFRFGR
jgi:hypothetical protein